MDTSDENTRILVVDDEQMLARVMARRLSSRGFEVEMRFRGDDALEYIQQEPELALVLLDVMMPDMSGLELLERIREHRTASELPVVMLTSRSDASTIVRALESGANDYVTKPAEMAVLLARVNVQLDRRRAVQALRSSEARYALAARGSRDVLWDWVGATDSLYLSDGCDRYLPIESGATFSGPPGSLHERIHPEDLSRLLVASQRMEETQGTELEIEMRLLSSDGQEWVWALVRGAGHRDPDGRLLRMAGSISDHSSVDVHDRTTGLPNRRLFLEQLPGRRQGQAPEGYTALVMVLDRADQIASTLGPDYSDSLAIAAAERLVQILQTLQSEGGPSPAVGSLCRLGGHQFAVSMQEANGSKTALQHARRLREALSQPFMLGPHEVRCGASVGVAHCGPSDDAETLLAHATAAAVRARTLPERVAMYSADAHRFALERLSLESELAAAIGQGQLHMEYQTIVDLETGRPRAVEALCRWTHPERGRIGPDVFIPIAEATGLAGKLGAWVLETSCRAALPWTTPAGDPLRICVNVSPIQFEEQDMAALVAEVLQRTGLDPHRLELEVTEGVFAQNPENLKETLGRLRATGVRIALDDFGTGYSSLSYLVNFPLDTLKLDRSFVCDLPGNGRAETITRATLAMAHQLQLEVVAEGIEEDAQAVFLFGLHCDLGQGWRYSRPMPAAHWDGQLCPALVARAL